MFKPRIINEEAASWLHLDNTTTSSLVFPEWLSESESSLASLQNHFDIFVSHYKKKILCVTEYLFVCFSLLAKSDMSSFCSSTFVARQRGKGGTNTCRELPRCYQEFLTKKKELLTYRHPSSLTSQSQGVYIRQRSKGQTILVSRDWQDTYHIMVYDLLIYFWPLMVKKKRVQIFFIDCAGELVLFNFSF